MAPLSKKAKTAAPPPGGGLKQFFGGAKSGGLAAAAPAPAVATAPGGPNLLLPAAAASGGLTEEQKKRIDENRRLALERKGLTDEQKRRIDENRRLALERKQAKANGQEVPKPTLPVPAPVTRNVAHDFDNADDFGNDDFEHDEADRNDDIHDGYAEGQESPMKSPTEAKPSLKRNGSDITPEKTSMPKDERRVMLPNPPATPVVQPVATPARAAPKPAVEEYTGVGIGEDKFKTFGKVRWMQYNNVYGVRLEKLRDSVLSQAKTQWSNEIPADSFQTSIATNSTGSSNDIVFVGVAFKSMPSRDNVIEQYRDCMVATSTLPEDDVDKQPNLCSDKDVLWLEDDTFRIELQLQADFVAQFATGLVMAVRGSLTSDGKFEAKDFCLAQCFTPTPLPKSIPTKGATPGPYLALLSGLFIGAPDENVEARNRAVDFLLARNQKGNGLKLAKAVEHVIVCGGVYAMGKLGEVPAGLQEADSMFSQLAEKLAVDVLPGHKDPSNLSLPQMPLHPFFFKTAQKCSQFKSVSNPYQCTLGDLEISGHSGQPVRDLLRCTSIPGPMQALTTCLDASLLAPTAPDTLVTQSFKEADPFIIEKAPQVLFSGGHDKAEYEMRTTASGKSGTLCVCVPAFHKQPALILVNLRDPREVLVQNFSA